MKLPQFAKWERELALSRDWSHYRAMSRADWLCTLGLKGCEPHTRSGYYTPFWRDPRRWLY